MTHLERVPGMRRAGAPCPVTLLGRPSLGEAARKALEQLGLQNPLTVAAVDPSVPVPGKPCLIVLDLEHNPLQGLAVLRSLRGQKTLSAMPVLTLGPDGDPALVEQAYAFGANSYLVQPTTDLALVECLRVALDYWLRISRTPD